MNVHGRNLRNEWGAKGHLEIGGHVILVLPRSEEFRNSDKIF